MNKITVDTKKCLRDGLCVAECPLRIIEMKGGSSVPSMVNGGEYRCIRCGHCVSICRSGALSLDGMKSQDCPPVPAMLSAAAAEGFLRSRRSIRVYRGKAVEREKLSRLIEIARYAPTGSNSQRVGWVVVESRARVKTMAGMVVDFFRHLAAAKNPLVDSYRLREIIAAWESGVDGISRGAPALVVAHAPKDYGLATVDCVLALTYLDLAAPSLGLGTCWGGYFMMAAPHWPPLQKALDLPEGRACYGVLMAGYPKHVYHRLPLRNPPTIRWG